MSEPRYPRFTRTIEKSMPIILLTFLLIAGIGVQSCADDVEPIDWDDEKWRAGFVSSSSEEVSSSSFEAVGSSSINSSGGSGTSSVGGGSSSSSSEAERYTLTVGASPANAGTVGSNPRQSNYVPGTQVTLTAAPATDYVFVNWTGGVTNLTGNSATVVMNANRTITANFEQRANNITLTLTYWETTDTDAGGPDPRIHFRVVAVQNGREVSSNNTGYLLDATDIGQSWNGSRSSSPIPFVAQADELRIYAVVVEKDLFVDDDISPGYNSVLRLPVANRTSGAATLNYGSGKSMVRFNYVFGRQ